MRRLILGSAVLVGMILAGLCWLLLGRLALDIVVGIGCVMVALFGHCVGSQRQAWARMTLLGIGLLGLAKCVASGLVHGSFWLPSGQAAHALAVVQTATGGVLLGLIVALAVSGQLLGTTSGPSRGEPAVRLEPPLDVHEQGDNELVSSAPEHHGRSA
jgi:hypothetical protein